MNKQTKKPNIFSKQKAQKMKKLLFLLIAFVSAVAPSLAQTAISFNGGTYYTVTNSTAAGINFTTQNFTIEAWVRPTAVASGSNTFENTILGNDIWTTTNTGYALRTGGSRKLSFVYGNGTSWYDCGTPTAVLTLNQWSHVAVTKNAGTVTIYVNGVSMATQTHAQTSISSGTSLNIGEHGKLENRKFTGAIHEVKFWNTGRTLSQIQSDTARECPNNGIYNSNLIAYFPMNETDNNTTT
jgi:hypothetical protein